MYAIVDRDDDLRIGVCSSAILGPGSIHARHDAAHDAVRGPLIDRSLSFGGGYNAGASPAPEHSSR
jgi:hypothetical protein